MPYLGQRLCRSVMSHVLVNTIEVSKVLNHGVSLWCQVMLEWLNATPGYIATTATTIDVLTAKGMISMETDRIWKEWLNDQIWRAWQ